MTGKNGIIFVRPDKTGAKPKERADEMARDDDRTLASFIRWLINQEYERRK